MSILGSIFSKILGHGSPVPANTNTAPQAPTSTGGVSPANTGGAAPAGAAPQAPSSSTTGASPSVANPSTVAPVDVGALLDGLAAKNSQKLDWKHSIVDMMKLLDLDSSLSARQALAQELHYSGDMHDSAAMNIWLHQQVMQKLAQNGGKVPDDLKA